MILTDLLNTMKKIERKFCLMNKLTTFVGVYYHLLANLANNYVHVNIHHVAR